MEEDDKFFNPGDLVKFKHEEFCSPTMLVQGKVMQDNSFKGIKCIWFSTDMKYNEQVFNTKDLVKL